MVSLDKFIIRTYRRISKDTINKVSFTEISKYIETCEETDLVYLSSVMLQYHPKLFNAMRAKSSDMRIVMAKCIKTKYYGRLIETCNENLELFNNLVKGTQNANRD